MSGIRAVMNRYMKIEYMKTIIYVFEYSISISHLNVTMLRAFCCLFDIMIGCNESDIFYYIFVNPNDLCIFESCIEIKIKLNFSFHTSLWCLKKFYEGLNFFSSSGIETGRVNAFP